MDELLKEIGKGMISLANMLLVLFFLNHLFLENIELGSGNIAIIIYIFTILYVIGGYFIKTGREIEIKKEK